jgi:A/G-specific adenine glycosylase
MLQQTQAARVEPIFEAFLARYPDVGSLAAAPRAAVIRAWSGLGYPRRAVRLHEAARAIVREHRGRVPSDPGALARLPGIGPYTAAAVASIGAGMPIVAFDTNVRRVCARALLGAEPDDVPSAELSGAATAWLEGAPPADWNQAVMDVGRLACRPLPRCAICPLARGCRFRAAGTPGRRSARRAPFEGSLRQARGAIVRILATRRSIDVDGLLEASGLPPERVAAALDGLIADGLVERTRGATWRLPVS